MKISSYAMLDVQVFKRAVVLLKHNAEVKLTYAVYAMRMHESSSAILLELPFSAHCSIVFVCTAGCGSQASLS